MGCAHRGCSCRTSITISAWRTGRCAMCGTTAACSRKSRRSAVSIASFLSSADVAWLMWRPDCEAKGVSEVAAWVTAEAARSRASVRTSAASGTTPWLSRAVYAGLKKLHEARGRSQTSSCARTGLDWSSSHSATSLLGPASTAPRHATHQHQHHWHSVCSCVCPGDCSCFRFLMNAEPNKVLVGFCGLCAGFSTLSTVTPYPGDDLRILEFPSAGWACRPCRDRRHGRRHR
jgi:hypothetical protein